MAIQISLCMIVKDEEAVLERCLQSAREIAEEIIIVDTGSRDRTKEIARRFTESVFDFPWCDDFAAARNFSFSKAKQEFCIWLDADDYLLPEDAEKLLALKQRLSSATDVVMLPYCLTREPDGTPDFWYYRERIVKNTNAFRWEGRVHEAITPSGNIVYGDAFIQHGKQKRTDPNRNLRILEQMRSDPKNFSPRHRFYYGRELWEHGRTEEAIRVLEDFLQSDGWTENKLNACVVLSDCYRRLERRTDAYRALLQGFLYDAPRAELCCALGNLFLEDSDCQTAAYWFETALTRPFMPEKGGFVQKDCYGYLPAIQLCVCYDRMGDIDRAEAYNEKAGGYRPFSEAYRKNKAYFSALRSTTK